MTGPMSASTNILIEAQRRGAKLRKSGREHVGLVLNAAAVIASPLTPKRGCGIAAGAAWVATRSTWCATSRA